MIIFIETVASIGLVVAIFLFSNEIVAAFTNEFNQIVVLSIGLIFSGVLVFREVYCQMFSEHCCNWKEYEEGDFTWRKCKAEGCGAIDFINKGEWLAFTYSKFKRGKGI